MDRLVVVEPVSPTCRSRVRKVLYRPEMPVARCCTTRSMFSAMQAENESEVFCHRADSSSGLSSLPSEHKTAIGTELVLLILAYDPSAVLDQSMDAPTHGCHRRRAWTHAVLGRASPSHIGVESPEGNHLVIRNDREGDSSGPGRCHGSPLMGSRFSKPSRCQNYASSAITGRLQAQHPKPNRNRAMLKATAQAIPIRLVRRTRMRTPTVSSNTASDGIKYVDLRHEADRRA